MGKITLLNHLKACAEAAKNFTNGLVGELAQSVTDALEEFESVKADKPVSTQVTIPITSWTEDESVPAYPVHYDIVVQGATEKDRASVMIAPESMSVAIACNLCPTCETVTGAIRIRAKSAPTTPISAEYWLEAGKENR